MRDTTLNYRRPDARKPAPNALPVIHPGYQNLSLSRSLARSRSRSLARSRSRSLARSLSLSLSRARALSLDIRMRTGPHFMEYRCESTLSLSLSLFSVSCVCVCVCVCVCLHIQRHQRGRDTPSPELQTTLFPVLIL
jgi:hypothetical protein